MSSYSFILCVLELMIVVNCVWVQCYDLCEIQFSISVAILFVALSIPTLFPQKNLNSAYDMLGKDVIYLND